MNEPKTLLSLTYQSTLPGAQDEIHTDVDQAFVKYAITEATRNSFAGDVVDISQVAPAKELLALAKRIEDGAAEQRKKRPGKPALALTEPTNQFFALMGPWLAAELALGAPQPDQPLVARKDKFPADSVLVAVYQLVYCSKFPVAAPAPGKLAAPVWAAVGEAARARAGNFNALLGPCGTLCSVLADEFNDAIWPWVW